MTRSTQIRLTFIVVLLALGILQGRSRAQQIGHAPVDVHVPRPPTPTVALGRLVCELHRGHRSLAVTSTSYGSIRFWAVKSRKHDHA